MGKYPNIQSAVRAVGSLQGMFGIDHAGLMVLGELVSAWELCKQVRTMQIVEGNLSDSIARAVIHDRIKHLNSIGVVDYVGDRRDGRVKYLIEGKNLDAVENAISATGIRTYSSQLDLFGEGK